jgi:uncharacterized protein
MRAQPFSRRLAVTLAIVALFVGGCLSRSPSPRYYALSSVPEGQQTRKGTSSAQNAVIGIGPVKLADYLEESQIVTRTSDHQLLKAEYDRWAGSLSDNLTNVLADNIGFLVPTTNILLYPWRTDLTIDYQVLVDVIRCDARLGEAAWLEARWSVLQGPDKKLLAMNRASIREPVTGADYAAVVAAQSRALAQLSKEIARAIQGAGKH